jgi:hypothetical protein
VWIGGGGEEVMEEERDRERKEGGKRARVMIWVRGE